MFNEPFFARLGILTCRASSLPHSVTQSSFADPCTYLAASGGAPAGFDSGLTSAKQFTINITDDTTRQSVPALGVNVLIVSFPLQRYGSIVNR
jgi:hypothetical protein